MLRPYVDATDLDGFAEWLARAAVPAAAILMPAGFFFSVLSRDTTKPNQLIGLLYAGAGMLAVGVVTAGIGLLTA